MTTAALDVRSALRSLHDSPERRGTARIASVLTDIEEAFRHGVSRAQVHATLIASGIRISFEGFKKALYRLRKKLRNSAVSTRADATPARAPTAQSSGFVVVEPAAFTPVRPAVSRPEPSRQVTIPPAPPSPDGGGWRPGRIGEIARSQPDMVGLAKRGREYAAKLNAEKKLKAEAEAQAKKDAGKSDIPKS